MSMKKVGSIEVYELDENLDKYTRKEREEYINELFKQEYPGVLKSELDAMINAYPDDRRFKEDLRMYQRLFGKK